MLKEIATSKLGPQDRSGTKLSQRTLHQSLNCPHCPYQASSILALGTHGEAAHKSLAASKLSFHTRVNGQTPQRMTLPIREKSCANRAEDTMLSVPNPDTHFWVDYKVETFLSVIGKRSRQKEIVNVLLLGATGTGKSSLPREFAAALHRPFHAVHCQLVAEQGDWWGSKEISSEKGTYFIETPFVRAIETPGCIILLDEANRTHPENLNALFGLLDQRRKAWISALNREMVVAPGVVFFVTLNEGMEYVGTNPVDHALRDRISNTVLMEFPPPEVEAEILVSRTGIDRNQAERLVTFAQTIRSNPKTQVEISNRRLVECAALIREGLSLDDTLLFCMLNGTTEEADKKMLLQALQITANQSQDWVGTTWDDD